MKLQLAEGFKWNSEKKSRPAARAEGTNILLARGSQDAGHLDEATRRCAFRLGSTSGVYEHLISHLRFGAFAKH